MRPQGRGLRGFQRPPLRPPCPGRWPLDLPSGRLRHLLPGAARLPLQPPGHSLGFHPACGVPLLPDTALATASVASLPRTLAQEEMRGRPRDEAPVMGPQEGLGRRPRPGGTSQERNRLPVAWEGQPHGSNGGGVDGALLWSEQATPQLHPCLQGGGKQPARRSVSARPQLQPHQSMW